MTEKTWPPVDPGIVLLTGASAGTHAPENKYRSTFSAESTICITLRIASCLVGKKGPLMGSKDFGV